MFTYQHVLPCSVYKLRSCLLMPVLMLIAGNFSSYAAAAAADKPRHVIVAPVVLKEISDRVEALGTARANESVNITSNVTEKSFASI